MPAESTMLVRAKSVIFRPLAKRFRLPARRRECAGRDWVELIRMAIMRRGFTHV
jgi:hypothetical protein